MTYPEFMDSPARGCAPGRVDPEIFFANPKADDLAGETAEAARAKKQRALARRVCRERCPFTVACFAWAERSNETAGIWGGVNMGSETERLKAASAFGIGPTPAKTAEPEPDEVLVDRVLKAGPAAFKALTGEQQTLVVRAGLSRGMGWNALERRFRINSARLKALVGEEAETFESAVRRLYHAGKSDLDIALTLDSSPKAVFTVRARLKLPALFGPGGRLRRRTGDARKARREQVSA